MPGRFLRRRADNPINPGQAFPLDAIRRSRNKKVAKAVRELKQTLEKVYGKAEYSGSVPVDDGSGSRYKVTRADGSKADVEVVTFRNFDDPRYENLQVIYDGAVDFEEGYHTQREMKEVVASAKKRYPELARANAFD